MNKNIKYKIPASLRNLVWNTYLNPELKNGICVCCNTEKISFSNFECGHVISRKDNGETTLENLRPICSLCNKSMGVMNMNLFIEKYGLNKKIDNTEDLIENNNDNETVKIKNDEECIEYIYLLNNINFIRFINYDNYIKIAYILKTNGIPFYYFDLFSKKIDNYNYIECLNYWNNLDLKYCNYDIDLLYKWFKEDNYDEYKKYKEDYNLLLNSITKYNIINFYFLICENNKKINKYIYNDIYKEWYYINNNNIWYKSKNYPYDIFDNIYNFYQSFINNKINFYNKKMIELEKKLLNVKILKLENKSNDINLNNYKIEIKKYNKYIENIKKIIKSLGNYSINVFEKNTIMKYTNNEFTLNTFNNPLYFAFNNKLIDFNNNNIIIRNIEPEDYIMNTTCYNYNEDEDLNKQNEIIIFFKSFFDNNELYIFFMKKIARCLNGNIDGNNLFNIYKGYELNRTPLIFNFIKNVFGNYYGVVNSDIITSKIKDADRADPIIFSLLGKRIAIISVIEDEITVNTKIIKSITNGDTLTGRNIYSKNLSFKPQCHLGIICNIKSYFKYSSNVIHTIHINNNVINYSYPFRDIENSNFLKLTDDDSYNRLFKEEYYLAFIHILIKIYKENFMNNLNIRDIPKEVKEQTKNYNEENDPITNWFNDNCIITGNIKDKIKSKELYDIFMNNTGVKITQSIFNNTLILKLCLEFKKFRDTNYFVKIIMKEKLDLELILNNTPLNENKDLDKKLILNRKSLNDDYENELALMFSKMSL